LTRAQSGPAADTLNPKHFTGAKPHTYQGNLWHLHPAIVKRLVPLPNFVNWKWELNEKRNAWTKVPYQPRDPTKKAATDNKKTWGTYTDAVANVVAGKVDGIGFCLFETNICAFDIDDCRDLATGEIDPAALALIRRCGATYVEKTVSGTGLRIIGLGGTTYVNRKQKINGSKVSIESYRNCARYITISGMTLDGVKPNIPDLGDIDALITDVVAELDDRTRKDDASPDDAFKSHAGSDDTGDAFLPGDLIELIEKGVPPQDDLSAAFHHAVCRLADRGWPAERIERRIAGKPIVPARYAKRLGREIARSLHKRKIKTEAEAASNPGSVTKQGPQGAGQGAQQTPPPRKSLADVHAVFTKWFGTEYDLDAATAAMAAAASERLDGDPLWLLIVAGPGGAKTETVQPLAGCGAYVTSTISSEGALLSATPHKQRQKIATGGLLRKIGDHGTLVIKDFTSILSADRNTRASVLAAIREVYDGRWERNVGTDGGQTLTWTGRIVIVAAVTTA
jgi:hypothetical protein